MLQSHIGLGLQTDAGTEDVGQSTALLGEGIDDRGAGRREWCLRKNHVLALSCTSRTGEVWSYLEHIAQNAQHAVETLVLVHGLGLPRDTRHHLGDNHQINDQWRRE